MYNHGLLLHWLMDVYVLVVDIDEYVMTPQQAPQLAQVSTGSGGPCGWMHLWVGGVGGWACGGAHRCLCMGLGCVRGGGGGRAAGRLLGASGGMQAGRA